MKKYFQTILVFLIGCTLYAQKDSTNVKPKRWQIEGVGIEFGRDRGNQIDNNRIKNYGDFENYIKNPALMPNTVYPEMRMRSLYHNNSRGVRLFLVDSSKKNFDCQINFGIDKIPYFNIGKVNWLDSFPAINNLQRIQRHAYYARSKMLLVSSGFTFFYKRIKWLYPYMGINCFVGQSYKSVINVDYRSYLKTDTDSIVDNSYYGLKTKINGAPFLYVSLSVPIGIRINFSKHIGIYVHKLIDVGFQYIYGKRAYYMPFRATPFAIGIKIKPS